MGNVKKIKIITHGILLVLLLSLPPGVAAEDPPCVAYAYTIDGLEKHYSLISNNSYVFGTQIYVVSNCENTRLIIDGQLITSGNNTLKAYTSPGLHEVIIQNNGFNQTFENVSFIQQGALGNMVNNLPAINNPYSEPYTPDEINDLELYSGVGAILLSWLLVVGVLWKLINNYQDRNFCQEVR